MKRYLYTIGVVLASIGFFSSCLSDSDSETTSYGDAAITAFTLTAINQYTHKTTSAGKDTVYKSTISGTYQFHIDQYGQRIFNTDSLPFDCDLKHVVVSITAKNSGVIGLKSLISDSIFYYSSSDSIDFTTPRTFRVTSNNGKSKRDYVVTFNQAIGTTGISWKEVDAATAEANAPQELFYDVKLLPDTGDKDFQLSLDGGETWSDEKCGVYEELKELPTEGLAYVSYPYPANPNTTYELLAGTCTSEGANQDICKVWRKLLDQNKNADPADWVQVPLQPNNKYYLPSADHLSLVYYKDECSILAFSSDGIVYQSRDEGITWKEHPAIEMPDAVKGRFVNAAVDSNGMIWLFDLTGRTVWRGGYAY
ncbi:MAG: DUF6242 domain-containing protein [Prevotella sp.]|nr:DUF6242 domain-containing protein [Prevotella sp.]